MSFLDKIFGLFANKNVEDTPIENPPQTYEDELFKKYGPIDEPNKKFNLKIMFIADTHDCLYYKKELQQEIEDAEGIDAYLLLGDHSSEDLRIIKSLVPNDRLFGIVGNHDSWNRLKDAGINDINKSVITINGVRIAALSGSTKYKEGDHGMYTSEESLKIVDSMPPADIFITHDKPFIKDENDFVHDGLKGITEYIYKNKIIYNIHGHLHYEYSEILKNGCKSICVYRVKVIDFSQDFD